MASNLRQKVLEVRQQVHQFRQQNEQEKGKNRKQLSQFMEWAKAMIEGECEDALDQLKDTNDNYPIYVYNKETPFVFHIEFKPSMYTVIDDTALSQLKDFTEQHCGPNVALTKRDSDICFEVRFD